MDHPQPRASARLVWVALLLALSGGCAAVTNPVGDGVPVRRVPAELLAPSKQGEVTIPLQLLGQPAPDAYRLAPGDVLGVYIEGFLGGQTTGPLPTHVGPQVLPREQRRLAPASGYPVPVQEDGSIDLPRAGLVRVMGLTLPEARQVVRDTYARRKLFNPDTTLVLIGLLQPRHYSVLVLRQEHTTFAVGPEAQVTAGTSKRGSGHEIDLPAYENDVLHALARTGGLPSLDAYNEVIILRNCFSAGAQRAALMAALGGVPGHANPLPALPAGGEVVRIPLRLPAGYVPILRPEDMVLRTGDVVFLEARDDDFFFTGGLLPAGAHRLPRDRDLDVVEAMAWVRGPLINGAFGGSNLSGALIAPGIGNPSPTLVTVVRRTPGGGQVSINVDLRQALRDPAERLLLRPGDLLILQEKPEEALARYFTQTFFNFDIFWQVFRGSNATGVIDIAAPDRLPGRVGTINYNPDLRTNGLR